jgi:hypothetical protein
LKRTIGARERFLRMADSFVVRLVRANQSNTLKHLLEKEAAIKYAQQHMDGTDRTEVYRIGTTNTREAMTAVQDGRAELIASYGKAIRDRR